MHWDNHASHKTAISDHAFMKECVNVSYVCIHNKRANIMQCVCCLRFNTVGSSVEGRLICNHMAVSGDLG